MHASSKSTEKSHEAISRTHASITALWEEGNPQRSSDSPVGCLAACPANTSSFRFLPPQLSSYSDARQAGRPAGVQPEISSPWAKLKCVRRRWKKNQRASGSIYTRTDSTATLDWILSCDQSRVPQRLSLETWKLRGAGRPAGQPADGPLARKTCAKKESSP